MSLKIIENRLRAYQPTNAREELSALKEIIQEIALSALARAGFFAVAAFKGGSCLRIVHKLERFSEDLDFTLIKPNETFVWDPLLKALQDEFVLYDLACEFLDRSKADQAVKQAFLKDQSFGKVLTLRYPRSSSDESVIKIKLEIDTNPPAGSKFEAHNIDFPYTFSLVTQDLPSLFAGKCHALLCRKYTKGRDWFDFVWYINKGVQPHYAYLQNALYQVGPWQGKALQMNKAWLKEALKAKIETVDWESARDDAGKFLNVVQMRALDSWGCEFFQQLLVRWG